MKFVIEFNGKYLVHAPYWDGGVWTDKIEEATIQSDSEFFKLHYPQFNIVEVKCIS